MSLRDPPHLSVSVYAPCTCGADAPDSKRLSHADSCAKVDESHPGRQRAIETVERNAMYWRQP